MLVNELWNAGHIALFALFSWLWLQYNAQAQAKSKSTFAIFLIVGTAAGLGIEIIQRLTGRDFSLFDVVRDVSGMVLVLAFCAKFDNIAARYLRILRGAVAVIVFLILMPLWMAAADYIIQYYQYPILSNFETPFENARWTSNTRTRIIENENSHVIEIIMLPKHEYNKVDLRYFHGNWADSDALTIDIYNTDSKNHSINLRIHDKRHAQGSQEYSDRYNNAFNLDPGWNTIHIPIEEVKYAPINRSMDLTKISNLQLFKHNLKEKWIIYIDNVRLLIDPHNR